MVNTLCLLGGLGVGLVIGWQFSQAGRRLDDNLEKMHADQARRDRGRR